MYVIKNQKVRNPDGSIQEVDLYLSAPMYEGTCVLPPEPLSVEPHPIHALLAPAFQEALQELLDHPNDDCIDEHTYMYLLEGY